MVRMNSQDAKPPYSYRQDSSVPPFPDDKPLFIFDGVCVLCSNGTRWLMRHDKKGIFRFSPAQSPTGSALYHHYDIALDETYLLIVDGMAYGKSDGYLQVCRLLGGWWRVLLSLQYVPRTLRNCVYDTVARNRYKWFGKIGYCELIPEDLKDNL